MSPDAHRDICGFHADNDLVKIHLLDQRHFVQCALRKSLSRHTSVTLKITLLQRSAVDANADRYAVFLCFADDLDKPLIFADVSGIDPDGISSGLDRCESQPPVKMDISHHRQMNLLFDLTE